MNFDLPEILKETFEYCWMVFLQASSRF